MSPQDNLALVEREQRPAAHMRSRKSIIERVVYVSEKPSRAKQEFQKECDINNILDKYKKTGVVTHLNTRSPDYGCAPDMDLREAIEVAKRANQQFLELPSKLRNHFQNDVQSFIEAVADPEQHDKLFELGLTVDDYEPSNIPEEPLVEPEAPPEEPPAP